MADIREPFFGNPDDRAEWLRERMSTAADPRDAEIERLTAELAAANAEKQRWWEAANSFDDDCGETLWSDIADEENASAKKARADLTALRAELAAANERSKANYTRWMRGEEEAEARETVLRAELDRANARADKSEDEFDRLSERMRVRMVECGVKLDEADKKRDALRAAAESVVDAYRDKGRATAALVGQCIEDLAAALALGGGDE